MLQTFPVADLKSNFKFQNKSASASSQPVVMNNCVICFYSGSLFLLFRVHFLKRLLLSQKNDTLRYDIYLGCIGPSHE